MSDKDRIQDLLEANNRYLERARAAEATVKELVEALEDKACDCTPDNQCQQSPEWTCSHGAARDLIAKAKAVTE